MRGPQPFGCGQCMPCRINLARQWTARQILEASLNGENNGFFTLTYSDAHLPASLSVEPPVVSLWLKRFRKALAPRRVRFFLCGEYGEKSQRPHYHLSVFGVQPGEMVGGKSVAQIAFETWGKCEVQGFEARGFGPETAAYCCGYVTKKMTKKDDPRLAGRHPEFARMSNRPGLGSDAMKIVADTLLGHVEAFQHVEEVGDVPHALKLGKRSLPLGRYLLGKLRSYVGFQPEYVETLKAAIAEESQERVLALLESALGPSTLEPHTAKSVYLASIEGKLASVEARAKLRASERKL